MSTGQKCPRVKSQCKEIVPTGKENARPPAILQRRKLSAADPERTGEKKVAKRRLSLDSESQKKEAAAGSRPAIGVALKTAFHVHRDDVNERGKPARAGPRATGKKERDESATRVQRKDNQVTSRYAFLGARRRLPSNEAQRETPQGPSTSVVKKATGKQAVKSSLATRTRYSFLLGSANKNRLTEPARSRRSNSVAPQSRQSASGSARSRSAEAQPQPRPTAPKRTSIEPVKRRADSKPTASAPPRPIPVPESVAGTSRCTRTRSSIAEAASTAGTSGGCNLEFGRYSDLQKSRMHSVELKGGLKRRLVAQEGADVNTPTDVQPPVFATGVKAVLRSRQPCEPRPKDSSEETNSRNRDSFPAELRYHIQYYADLLNVEREREERAPRLSHRFLLEDVNAEQRKLVVIFLIHLATHCRYPSYLVYQTVKLFDAVIDRVHVEVPYIQLTALAALWITLKRQENFQKIPSATKMIAHAKEMYVGREDLLIKYEQTILLALNFNFTFPDAFSLLTYHLTTCTRYVSVSDETKTFLYNCGGYLIDLTLLDEKFCCISTSLVAFTVAEIVVTLTLDRTFGPDWPRWKIWRVFLTDYSSYSERFEDDDITFLRVAILRRLINSGKKHSSFEVVYKKYSRSRYGRISDRFLERVKRIPYAEIFDP